MKTLPLVITLAVLAGGCSESKPNVEIETRNMTHSLFAMPYVTVKAKAIEDDVIVKDIIVNRGNCKLVDSSALGGRPTLPEKLKFGGTVTATFSPPCEASQVDIVTNKGSWSQTY